MPELDIELRTDRLILRPTGVADAARLAEIQSNWNVVRMLRLAPWPASEAAMCAWIGEHAQERAAGTAWRFAVTLDGRVIGVADVDDIEGEAGELGYWFDEACWGRGYAKEAAGAVLRFAVEGLGLRRLAAGHAADNPASGRVLTHLGFTPAGDTVKFSRPHGCDAPYRMYRLIVPSTARG